MASSYSTAQTPLRGHGNKKCPHHFGNDVIYVCENCDSLACVECVTKIHKGHDLEALSDVVTGIKQNIKDFINKAEQDEIPQITEKLQAVDHGLTKTRQHCQHQISKVKDQNHKLKQELDDITDKLVKSYQDLEQDSIDTLLQDSQALTAHLDELNSRVHACKDSLHKGNHVLVYDISKDKTLTFSEIPTIASVVNLPEFIPWAISLPELAQTLGEQIIEDLDNKEQLKNQVSTTSDLQNLPEESEQKHPDDQLSNWTVTSQFKPYENKVVTSMHALPGNQVWLASSFHNVILLTDHLGNIKKALTAYVGCFCLSPRNKNIWYCDYIGGVKEVVDEVSSVRFRTQKEPKAICVTADDHIVLVHKHYLAKYTPSGQVITKTATGLFKTPVVRKPTRITECPVTRNLAVIDEDGRNHDRKDVPYIAILDKDLMLLHTYHGAKDGKQLSTRVFSPFDICYTREGNLVVTDTHSKVVIFLSGQGMYMKTVYFDRSSSPKAVCVQNNTILVSLYSGSVQVLTYK